MISVVIIGMDSPAKKFTLDQTNCADIPSAVLSNLQIGRKTMQHPRSIITIVATMPLYAMAQGLDVDGGAKISEEIPPVPEMTYELAEFHFTTPDMKNNLGAYMSLTGRDGNNGGANYGRIQWQNVSDGNELSGKLSFWTANESGSITQALTINELQNVGVGTSLPTARLNVVDDVLGTSFYLQNDFAAPMGQAIEIARIHGPNIADGSGLILKVGQSSSFRNEADIRFDYAGFGSADNALSFGFNSVQPFVFFMADEQVGIGTSNPKTKLQVANGDVYIEDIGNGVIMKSPNGTCWRMTIADSGAINTASLACP